MSPSPHPLLRVLLHVILLIEFRLLTWHPTRFNSSLVGVRSLGVKTKLITRLIDFVCGEVSTPSLSLSTTRPL